MERINERHLLPVLAELLRQYLFRIRGFHTDSGSEYVNHTVAELLEKLRIQFTKSRPRRTNDQALVEGKNGSTVRKQIAPAATPPTAWTANSLLTTHGLMLSFR